MFSTDNVCIDYTFDFKGLPVRAGMFLKIKGIYGVVRFECIAHDLDANRAYLIVHIGKEVRKVPVERLQEVAILKRTIRKKIYEPRTANG